MDLKRHLLEAATLVAAAAVCAAVSNAIAEKEKKLPVVGRYSSPTTVPAKRVPSPEAIPLTDGPPPTPVPDAPTPVVPAPTPAPARSPMPAAAGGTVAAARTAPSRATATPAPSAPKPAAAQDPKKRFPPHGQPSRDLGGDDVAWLHAQGGILFLDARRSSVYQEGHIAGARSFPIWEDAVVTPRIEALAQEGRDGDVPVVVYCSGGNCEDSHMLCERLFGLGFNNLLIYHDGWPDWQKRGGASRTGPEP